MRQPLSPAPEPIIARLNVRLTPAGTTHASRHALLKLTVTPLVLTAAEFGAYITAETAKWAKVIKLASIKAE
jgi:tripartite-type tricarboxylate transporter receptor subunit TctC